MDKKTIGTIEELLNLALKQEDIWGATRWARDVTILNSPDDFVLGYMLGSLMSSAYEIALRKKVWEKIEKIENKRLEKSLGKEKAKEVWKQWRENLEMEKPKFSHLHPVMLTEEARALGSCFDRNVEPISRDQQRYTELWLEVVYPRLLEGKQFNWATTQTHEHTNIIIPKNALNTVPVGLTAYQSTLQA